MVVGNKVKFNLLFASINGRKIYIAGGSSHGWYFETCLEFVLQNHLIQRKWWKSLRLVTEPFYNFDWKVGRIEDPERSSRQANIIVNNDSLGPLTDVGAIIGYGFSSIILKLYNNDVPNPKISLLARSIIKKRVLQRAQIRWKAPHLLRIITFRLTQRKCAWSINWTRAITLTSESKGARLYETSAEESF